MNKFLIIVLSVYLPAAALCFLATPAMAKNKADIVDIEVTKKSGNLEVSFSIENCFTPEMEEAIQSGVPATFRIHLILEKTGFHLFGSKLLDNTLEHSIRYDRLKNQYMVQIPEHIESMRITDDLDEAKCWMSTIERLPVIPLWRLEKGRTYQLNVKAELSKFQLPFFLRYVLFFVSLWDFETSWQNVTFSS